MTVSRASKPGEPVTPWSAGWAQYFVEERVGSHLLLVAARCRFPCLGTQELALLDTGAHWSLVGGELAEAILPHTEYLGIPKIMRTWLADVEGHLGRVDVELIADEGNDLRITDATILLAPEWPGPPVILGYRGLLERIRLGLDPGIGTEDQWLCFGPVDDGG